MSSAKFLKEALSTGVDESAVNPIMDSLETQLVTSTPTVAGHQASSATVSQQNHQVNNAISNGGTITTLQPQNHGVSNGGGATTVNSLMTQEVAKSITTSTLLPVNVVTSNAMVPQVVTTQQQDTQAAGISAFINQATRNQVSSNQITTEVANVNNKFTFPAQTVAGQQANEQVTSRVAIVQPMVWDKNRSSRGKDCVLILYL